MNTRLIWSKIGENYRRGYRSRGKRASYRIILDPVSDRWVLFVNSVRSADDFLYQVTAQQVAETYELEGALALPQNAVRTAAERPRLIHGGPSPIALMERGSGVGSRDAQQILSPSCREELAERLRELVVSSGVLTDSPAPPWETRQSGVYSVVDCIYRVRSHYEYVVLPMLRRLATRPGLGDCPCLKFSAFLADVDRFGPDKFTSYADHVLTRNKLAGRLKVEICYDVCRFFVDRNIETIDDIREQGDSVEKMILEDLQLDVRGIGVSLAHQLLSQIGYEDHVNLDAMIVRFWSRMNIWTPAETGGAWAARLLVDLTVFRNPCYTSLWPTDGLVTILGRKTPPLGGAGAKSHTTFILGARHVEASRTILQHRRNQHCTVESALPKQPRSLPRTRQ
jgi:hypothetical protein